MRASVRSKEFYLAALHRDGAVFRDAVTTPGALDRPVPSCPGWTVARLVGHLGVVYDYQRAHFVRGEATKPTHERTQPPEGEAVIAWWQDQFNQTAVALERIDPNLPAWNWTVRPMKAIFWHRRMAQETAVHRWDAQVSVGTPEPIETELAIDGVEEVLDSFLPAGRRKGPDDKRGVVRLQPTDAEAKWVVRVRGAGLSLLDTDTVFDDPPHAQAAAFGTASDLLLALWGRVPLSVLTIQGEPELVSALRTG